MANLDIETKIPDVLVHITYPDKKDKNITITGYAIHKRPRCRVDGQKDYRKTAKNKDEIDLIIERVVNTVIDAYNNQGKKEVEYFTSFGIDSRTKIGNTFLLLKKSKRLFNKLWAESTTHSYLTFYEKNVIPEIQYYEHSSDFGLVEFEDLVSKIARKTFSNGNFSGETLESAKNSVRLKLTYAYPIFSELRYMDPSIPDLHLKADDVLTNSRPKKEQVKYVPLWKLKKFRSLLEKDVEIYPKQVRGAVLMENVALRTSEAAGWTMALCQDFDHHLIIWVLVQEGNLLQNPHLKSKSGYRYTITDDWGTNMLKKCNEIIGDEKTGIAPLSDKDLSEYVKEKLIEAGFSKEFISETSNELQATQGHGQNRDIDVAAYCLRRIRASIWRNICGYTQNELDFALGHIPVNGKKNYEDMWNVNVRERFSIKNRRFDLNPEVSQSPRYKPIEVNAFKEMNIIPFNEYRFVNNGDKPIKFYLTAATAEYNESIIVTHKKNIESKFECFRNTGMENASDRQHEEIIGAVDLKDIEKER